MRSTTKHHKNYLKVLKHQTNRELLLELMNKLPEKYRIVIALRYGIPVPGLIDVDDKSQTIESVAKRLGLSCTRIIQIHNAAIGKIVRLLTVEKPENDDYKKGKEMNGMINISMTPIGDKIISTVSAHDLHALLNVKRDFSTWIRNSLKLEGFVENSDFIINVNDYFISLNVAKNLSLMECNQIGSRVCQKLIKYEKTLNTLPDQGIKDDPEPIPITKHDGIIVQVFTHTTDSTVQKFRYKLAPHCTNKFVRSTSKFNSKL